jgi:hypothetical protein
VVERQSEERGKAGSDQLEGRISQATITIRWFVEHARHALTSRSTFSAWLLTCTILTANCLSAILSTIGNKFASVARVNESRRPV